MLLSSHTSIIYAPSLNYYYYNLDSDMFSTSTSDDIPTLFYPSSPQLIMERVWKPNTEVPPNCPRCASTNTKFCYYNNYSLSQPRYFCKGCRRYWTKGGSLRNVPHGGGCRKILRPKSSRSGVPRHATSSGRGGGSGEELQDDNAAEIDLAAVFAKYLNPCDADTDQKDTSSGASTYSSGSSLKSSHSPESEEQVENGYFECQNPMELDNVLRVDDDQPRVVHNSQVSSDEYLNVGDLLEVRSILGDDETSHYQDLSWSGNSDLPNIPWQHPPMVQLEDFGSFTLEDHLNMADQAHLEGVNWSSFDLSSGFEVLQTLT